MRYRVPAHLAAGRSTVVAINVGGAIVPLCICAWILAASPAVFLQAVLGTAIVTFVVHRAARPVPGLGIATPMFIPPIVAALVGMLLSGGVPHHADAIAYVSGVIGTLDRRRPDEPRAAKRAGRAGRLDRRRRDFRRNLSDGDRRGAARVEPRASF